VARYRQGVTDTAPATATPADSLEDIQWLRTRRRTATTAAEHAVVRHQLGRLARHLEQRPEPTSPGYYVALAVVSVVGGLTLGFGLYHLADGMWVWLNS